MLIFFFYEIKLLKQLVVLIDCDITFFILHRNIFLGETFSSYISVHNDSNQIVKDILVKVKQPSHPAFLKHFLVFHILTLLCVVMLSRLICRRAHRGSTSLHQTMQSLNSNLNAALMTLFTTKSRKLERICEAFCCVHSLFS